MGSFGSVQLSSIVRTVCFYKLRNFIGLYPSAPGLLRFTSISQWYHPATHLLLFSTFFLVSQYQNQLGWSMRPLGVAQNHQFQLASFFQKKSRPISLRTRLVGSATVQEYQDNQHPPDSKAPICLSGVVNAMHWKNATVIFRWMPSQAKWYVLLILYRFES